jgi:hypothetical protein
MWKTIASAPTDRHILLYGKQVGGSRNDEVKWDGNIVASGYWDGIDTSWCVTGSTWRGPFIKPTHWMELPEAPVTNGDDTDAS